MKSKKNKILQIQNSESLYIISVYFSDHWSKTSFSINKESLSTWNLYYKLICILLFG